MYRCERFGCVATGHDVMKRDGTFKVGYGGVPIAICKHCHSRMLVIDDVSDWQKVPFAEISAIHTAAEVSAEIEVELLAEDGSALNNEIMGDMFGVACSLEEMVDITLSCPDRNEFRDKGPYEEDVPEDILEWNRVRDGIDDSVIALKGYCDELGATHIADKVQYIYRKLQDIAYTKFNMGD